MDMGGGGVSKKAENVWTSFVHGPIGNSTPGVRRSYNGTHTFVSSMVKRSLTTWLPLDTKY